MSRTMVVQTKNFVGANASVVHIEMLNPTGDKKFKVKMKQTRASKPKTKTGCKGCR